MLTQRVTVNSSTFTRRDLRRLVVAMVLLVTAMTAIFALDLVPQPLVIETGDVAPSNIVAPRTQSYVSEVRTAAERAAAVKDVQSVYDYGTQKALGIANAQVAKFDARVGPIDRAFDPGTAAVRSESTVENYEQ